MLELGPIAFASPWLLLALLLLPLLWRLLRVIPPVPRPLRFPPIRFLLGLTSTEETPHTTPPWLILLRIAIAALIILALAQPLLNPGSTLPGSGPVMLVIDDGWAAGRNWPPRQRMLAERLDQAERAQRPVILLTTAPPADGQPIAPTGLLSAADARTVAQALQPKPWPSDRRAALAAIEDLHLPGSAHVVWLADGLEDTAATETGNAVAALAGRLQRFGSLEVLADPPTELPVVLLPPEVRGDESIVEVLRPDGADVLATPVSLWLRGTAADGRMLVRERVAFDAGAARAEVRFVLPVELRNDLVRLEIEGETTAGSVVLLDERWRRRPIGLVSTSPLDNIQPLLTELFYLERALEPFSDVRRGGVSMLLREELAVLVLTDANLPDAAEREAILEWIERGGLALRFAGPNLAESADELTPVALRRGGRALGGALSWSEPARLAPFGPESPFLGLRIPADVSVTRQVLAEPSLDLAQRSWARLADGTPLVTAARRGEGWLVLMHTSANTAWSDLSISGLFVEMLQRIVRLSQGVPGEGAEAVLPPLESLDGFGRLGAPPSVALPVSGPEFKQARPAPETPPGFYGRGPDRRALNLSPSLVVPRPIGELPAGVTVGGYSERNETNLRPWLIAAAFLLFLADSMIALALRGLLRVRWKQAAAGATALALVIASTAGSAVAQKAGVSDATDEFILKGTLETRLAYVATGVPETDSISRAGLTGLSIILNRRTAVEAAEPMAVEIERDELSLFPLLYWPLSRQQRPPSTRAVRKLNAYLANGGTILFDTRDSDGGGGGSTVLRQLTRGLKIPPLVPVPPDHVLTRAFYLMQDFPGRWAAGTLWVEPAGSRLNDGVSPVIVGANDYAAAWAADEAGRAMFPVVPGGELQREMAYRFGVNLVMYALTGNYKSDQVHVPAILERLGQ